MELKDVFGSEFIKQEPDFGYKSPIEIIYGELETKMENDTFEAIRHYDINVDKEELIKALKYDREQYMAGYKAALKEMSNYVYGLRSEIDPFEYEKLARLETFEDYVNSKLKQILERECK